MVEPEHTYPGDPLIGKQLGDYKILRRVGHGGMATVYVAEQLSLAHREVALKVMRPDLMSADPTFYDRFQLEVKILGTYQQIHIVPVFDCGEAEGYIYLAMRLMRDSLQQYIRKYHPIPVTQVGRFLTQIAGALDYAHGKKVVHRDLKPANVLLDDQDNCYLADFGIARLLDADASITQGEGLIGTLHYMAPEVIQGDRGTAASDVYSLGIMLYELLCGKVPFDGESTFEILNDHIKTIPPPVLERRRDLPPGCPNVVNQALAKDPEERYVTAGDMARAFDQALLATTGETKPLAEGPAVPPPIPHSQTPILRPQPHAAVPAVRLWQRILTPTRPKALVALAILIVGLIGGFLLFGGQGGSELSAAEYNAAGLEALTTLDYNAAIRNFAAALRQNPNDAATHFNLGVAYEELGDLEAARAAYETALDLDQQLLMARYRLAELLLDAGEVDEAFGIANAGVRILNQGDPGLNAEDQERLMFLLLTTRGRAYYQRGGSNDLQLAETDLLAALTREEAVDYPAGAYYYLALVYEALGNTDDARQAWFDVIANCDPNSPYQQAWKAEARTRLAGQ